MKLQYITIMEIKEISRETIKPSSPTPESKQRYNLSFLDQLAPPMFMPIVYFYQHDPKSSSSKRATDLKTSLSQALTTFYPLAGRLVENQYVECNDMGASFVEAEVNCELNHVIKHPIPRDMDKFIPYKLDDTQNLGVAVQVTTFRCGGTAVGLLVSHKIADALSYFKFANMWAAIARHEDHILPQPKFESASIFPPRDIAGYKPSVGMLKEELVTKIFTFPSSKVSVLRDRYAGRDSAESPQRRTSRIEALSAFIWTRFMSATEVKHDTNKIFTLIHAVNLRNRLEPPLSDDYFGNISRLAMAMPNIGEGGFSESGYEVLQKVREAIRGVNAEYVGQVKQGDKHLNVLKEKMARFTNGEMVTFSFTSLCRFPLYEADFGWGKPAWVGSASLMYKNLVTFMDSASGDGIDAWINLRKEDMKKFEEDLELRTFLAPSVDNGFSFGLQEVNIII